MANPTWYNKCKGLIDQKKSTPIISNPPDLIEEKQEVIHNIIDFNDSFDSLYSAKIILRAKLKQQYEDTLEQINNTNTKSELIKVIYDIINK